MRFAAAIVIACGGCKALLGIDDGVVADAGADAPVDMQVDASDCLGAPGYELCMTAATGDVVLGDGAIDTTACSLGVVDTQHGWCVIGGRTVRVTGKVTVSGSRPLVLVAARAVTVARTGVLDASSDSGRLGPGANDPLCAVAGGGAASNEGGGGGAGGTLGTRGGAGGFGASGTTARGMPAPVGMAEKGLRGGCAGGRGGTPNDPAGSGGGAVYLAAGIQITVLGEVTVSGAGGGAGKAAKGGGSGGGSGGTIFLAAPELYLAEGRLWANGGGGGGGADNGAGGMAGGVSIGPADMGSGGTGGSPLTGAGGNGGISAFDGFPGTDDMTGAGGGGGGGGVGVIRVFGAIMDAGGTLSPPAT